MSPRMIRIENGLAPIERFARIPSAPVSLDRIGNGGLEELGLGGLIIFFADNGRGDEDEQVLFLAGLVVAAEGVAQDREVADADRVSGTSAGSDRLFEGAPAHPRRR